MTPQPLAELLVSGFRRGSLELDKLFGYLRFCRADLRRTWNGELLGASRRILIPGPGLSGSATGCAAQRQYIHPSTPSRFPPAPPLAAGQGVWIAFIESAERAGAPARTIACVPSGATDNIKT